MPDAAARELPEASPDRRRETRRHVDEPAAIADVEQLFHTIDAVPTAGRIGTSIEAPC